MHMTFVSRFVLSCPNTYPFLRGVILTYILQQNKTICPFQPIIACMAAQPRDPLYNTLASTPLTRLFVIDKLNTLFSRLGYDPALYSGHSFRIGAATAATATHIPDHMIRTLGRWNSDCFCIYIHSSLESWQ